MLKFNKEEFLKTQLGRNLVVCIIELDTALKNMSSHYPYTSIYEEIIKKVDLFLAEWKVYQTTIKQFYGLEYVFTRTEEYVGLVTEDESNWLFRIYR